MRYGRLSEYSPGKAVKFSAKTDFLRQKMKHSLQILMFMIELKRVGSWGIVISKQSWGI